MPRELKSTQPGYFEIFLGPAGSGWYFLCNCPCGCPYLDIVPLELGGEHEHQIKDGVWDWDGDLERPTISPSFKRNGTPCKVHFNLNAGVYTIHPDGAPGAPNLYRVP